TNRCMNARKCRRGVALTWRRWVGWGGADGEQYSAVVSLPLVGRDRGWGERRTQSLPHPPPGLATELARANSCSTHPPHKGEGVPTASCSDGRSCPPRRRHSRTQRETSAPAPPPAGISPTLRRGRTGGSGAATRIERWIPAAGGDDSGGSGGSLTV